MTDTGGVLCGCGHMHTVGDDEGADGGCSLLGHGCDCWDWHDAVPAAGDALDTDLRTLRRLLPIIVDGHTGEAWLAFWRIEKALGRGIYADTEPAATAQEPSR